MPIHWREKLSLGHQAIDDDHKTIICSINAIETVIQKNLSHAVLISFLEHLYEVTEVHFENEEKFHELYHYPDRKSHQKTHKILLSELQEITEKLSNQSENDSLSTDALLIFLKNWIINHIIGHDLKLKPYIH